MPKKVIDIGLHKQRLEIISICVMQMRKTAKNIQFIFNKQITKPFRADKGVSSTAYKCKTTRWSDEANVINDLQTFSMEDSLEVCNFRIAAKNAINQVNGTENVPPTSQEDVDVSLQLQAYFLDQSSVYEESMEEQDETTVHLNDTMDVCNYRRLAAARHSVNDLAELSNISLTECVVHDHIVAASFNESIMDSSLNSNTSAISSNTLTFESNGASSSNESANKLDDSMNICNYRHNSWNEIEGAIGHRAKTPVRADRLAAYYLNKTVAPQALFNTPSGGEFREQATGFTVLKPNSPNSPRIVYGHRFF